MDLFADLIKANQDLQGRVQGISYGIVATTEDPMGLGRIQCLDAAKGGKSTTDWLFRVLPFSGFSPPLPIVGDTILMGFIDGNPHQGIYFGSLQNIRNPAVNSGADLVFIIGETKVQVTPDGQVVISGATKVQIKSLQVEFLEATSVTINGSQVATVGAMDTDGESLVTKGWV